MQCESMRSGGWKRAQLEAAQWLTSAPSTPPPTHRIAFIREFQHASKFEKGGLDPQAMMELQTASEPFSPDNVYDAMRMKKRFDAMRVSSTG